MAIRGARLTADLNDRVSNPAPTPEMVSLDENNSGWASLTKGAYRLGDAPPYGRRVALAMTRRFCRAMLRALFSPFGMLLDHAASGTQNVCIVGHRAPLSALPAGRDGNSSLSSLAPVARIGDGNTIAIDHKHCALIWSWFNRPLLIDLPAVLPQFVARESADLRQKEHSFTMRVPVIATLNFLGPHDLVVLIEETASVCRQWVSSADPPAWRPVQFQNK
jgi:hypothetical protein